MRKLLKIGKRKTEDQSFLDSNENQKSEDLNEKNPQEKVKKEPRITLSKEELEKHKEINSHLKKVLLTSLFCIIVLFALYHFEKQNQWIERFGSKIQNTLKNIDWKM